MAPICGYEDCIYQDEKKSNVFVYWDGYSVARCTFQDSATHKMYVDNFIVRSPMRGSGIGRQMIRKIRSAFPNAHIVIETFESSRPFWVKMQSEGFINEIAN
jgi:hypothetical protein